MSIEGIGRICFGASYAVALGLELLNATRPRRPLRYAAVAFGAAGLVAHTLYLALHRPSVALPSGSLLVLAWVVAVFGVGGAVHHRKLAWAVFVLPLVLALIGLAQVFPPAGPDDPRAEFTGDRFWGQLHGGLILLAAVGVSVGFVASVMYLVQARRLRAKAHPRHGLRLLSLERLEAMNRRAVHAAFPLLTAGLFVGVLLLVGRYDGAGWTAPKVIGTVGLWAVFALLLYLRHGAQVPGRRLARLTVGAFVVLLATLAAAHPVVTGGAP